MELNQAILHRIGEDGDLKISKEQLDIQRESNFEFIEGHIKKIYRNTSTREGLFKNESDTYKLIQSFINKETMFYDLSVEIAKRLAFFVKEFSEVEPGGILVCEYYHEDTANIFICKIPYRECFVQEQFEETYQINRTEHMLPSLRSQIKEACIIPFSPMILRVLEESVSMDGEYVRYFSDMFLEAEGKLSQKEVVDNLVEIHEHMAADKSEAPFEMDVEMAKWGQQVVEETEESEQVLSVYSLADRLFEDEETKERYLQSALERGIKDEMLIQKGLITRNFAKQTFKTANGLQIQLPVEMIDDDEVELIENEDGSVTIMLKNLREKDD